MPAQPGSVARWVNFEEVLEGEAQMWPNAAALRGVRDEREGGRPKAAPVFWTVGVEEVPGA